MWDSPFCIWIGQKSDTFLVNPLNVQSRMLKESYWCQLDERTAHKPEADLRRTETMKSFIGSLVYCLSLLLVDLCESYDFNNPSHILAQSYAQRRNHALPHRTLNPAGKFRILSNFLSSNVCIVSWPTLHHCNETFMVSLFSLMHYKNCLLSLCLL